MLAQVNAGRPPEDRALLCVDGVHGFGTVDVPVADLGCDYEQQYVRFGSSIVTTPDQMDRVVDAVRDLRP